MKTWISALTWSFLRLIAPVRRSFHAALDMAKKLEKLGDFVSAKGVQRFFRAASLNFIAIDLLTVARMNTARSRQKATGRDLLSNEVMQAGGRPMAEPGSELAIKIADTEQWPKEFQGGRVTELFKKGSRLNCDDYRAFFWQVILLNWCCISFSNKSNQFMTRG